MENTIELITKGEIENNGRKFTKVYGGFGEDKPILTDLQVAELLGYNNGARTVRQTLNINRQYFNEDIDFIDVSKGVADNDILKETLISLGYAKASITQAKSIYILSEKGFIRFLSYADIDINNYINFIEKYFNSDMRYISAPRKEILFIKSLSDFLYVFDIVDGIKQYYVKIKNNNYRIDYYIPSLNIAIEYDENGHANYTYAQHEGRQKEIEEMLGCRFIRVDDSKTDKENLKIIYNNIKSHLHKAI